MSIILGPYDNRDEGNEPAGDQRDNIDDEELFVFGYACKLFRDDAKGILENSGQLLIPWMGDGSLMVDRYDIRNRLEDKAQFGLKPILPRRRTEDEDEFEERLDQERYLALGVDILEHELLEAIDSLSTEESKKRQKETSGSYQAVGFTYKDSQFIKPTSTPTVPVHRPEHPPTITVDVLENEEDCFIPPPGLIIPGHIRQPITKKVHSIIERTAGFVAKQGTQMEIMIKTKQKYNPLFSFVSLYDPLHSYYRHLLQLIASGGYTPQIEEEKREGGGEGQSTRNEKPAVTVEESDREDDEDSDNSDEEGFELHPLLRVSTTPRSSPKPPNSKIISDPSSTNTNASTITTTATDHHHTTSSSNTTTTHASFFSKSLTVNAAPSLETEQIMTNHHSSLESQSNPAVASNDQGYPHNHTDGQSLHPQLSDFSSQSNLEAYYHRLSADHINRKSSPFPRPLFGPNIGPPPPPPDLQPIIDKTAEYVARNSEEFERTVLEKHAGDPKFGFLNPWDKYYPYYKLRLQLNKERAAEEALAAIEHDIQKTETQRAKNVQRLSQSGAVCFKLQPKKVAILDAELIDLGPSNEEEEDEEEVEKIEAQVVKQKKNDHSSNIIAQQATVEDGYTMTGQMTYQHDDSTGHYYDTDVHYSAEGTYYCHGNNGEVVDGDGGEDGENIPPAKRSKTASDENTIIMDNKVQEFLSQVKAVLDS